MVQPVRKAVFPVAGLGTRFLPATKVMPKEMLPIVNKPLIQYGVEEAIEARSKDEVLLNAPVAAIAVKFVPRWVQYYSI